MTVTLAAGCTRRSALSLIHICIGKISGVVVGVFIFTALTYSLTTLGIDTNLQFVFSGIIILA